MKACKLAIILAFGSSLIAPAMASATETPHRWDGYYAGLNVGVVNHTMNITDNQATLFYSTLQQTTGPKFTGGFQVGYRKQLDLSNITGVYGGEFSGNFAYADYNKNYGSPFALYQFQSDNELKNYYLLQMLGGIAVNKVLLFFAAGLSWTNITGSIYNQNTVVFFNSINMNDKAFGTALGAGMEYAYNDALSIRFKVDAITPWNYTADNNSGGHFAITNSIVQGTIGLNYNLDKIRWHK